MSANLLKKIVAGTSVVLMGLGLTACGSDDPNQLSDKHQRIAKELQLRGFTDPSWEEDGAGYAVINVQMGECRAQIKRYTNGGNYELVRKPVDGIEGIQFPDPSLPLVKSTYPELAPCFTGDDTAPTAHPDDK
jgi:hypothetical protein